ncbi:uncharacterized protein LOC132704298 [Cylas formicarius]|uniref:uncharacterized protein LOC132704298 n=1 Tax=Cylas formicarius TaxID=197179 RepID=UPI002958C97F|nr:uncharacterized protein LOC132704298 [Cylas formicarius]XP_060530181.1 uncharacterized protein LOC132704298 [Cylas formicarius]
MESRINAELMFECLIYLNMFYFPVFATCETIITVAKYFYAGIFTPNIKQDAAVIFTRIGCELTKILLYRKFKEEKRSLITAIAVFFTCITIAGVAYTFAIQTPALKLEHILSSLTIMLAVTEVTFGMLQLINACCRRDSYY